MHMNEYQGEVQRTAAMSRTKEDAIAIFALGVGGEAGEVCEIIKKHIGHGQRLDKDKLTKEIGDVLWYLAALAHACDIEFEHVAQVNIEKLRARYPNGFTVEDSAKRADVCTWCKGTRESRSVDIKGNPVPCGYCVDER
jgi:NTP pyrophosphatase (non-canonical NTP hydrolase)